MIAKCRNKKLNGITDLAHKNINVYDKSSLHECLGTTTIIIGKTLVKTTKIIIFYSYATQQTTDVNLL